MNDDKVTEPGDFEYRDLVKQIGAEWSVEDQEWKIPFYDCPDKAERNYDDRFQVATKMMTIDNWNFATHHAAVEIAGLLHTCANLKKNLKRHKDKIALIKDLLKNLLRVR